MYIGLHGIFVKWKIQNWNQNQRNFNGSKSTQDACSDALHFFTYRGARSNWEGVVQAIISILLCKINRIQNNVSSHKKSEARVERQK